ncbi:MAG TPA: glycosyltransferase family 39 protein [Myxococcales bacterium]|nr:glycosyltransferase family 39 protein [Myxococcales bacterium]
MAASAGAGRSTSSGRICAAAILLAGAALLAAPWLAHFDDTDAQLYQVVVRTMARSGAWLDPRYLEHLYPRFREHLPFALWPYAVAVAALGEHAGPALAALFSVLTLALVVWTGDALLGRWAGLAAGLVLATTETFFRYGGAVRLDPLLVLLSTAACVPALLGWRSRRSWAIASALAALAMLVKPPFGLVPFFASAAARAIVDRSWRPLARGALGAAVACVPVVAFLAVDRAVLHAGWWTGYVQSQLLGSALGRRTDGSTQWWFPFLTVAGRFWPGLALVAVAAWLRPAKARVLWPWSALILLALCLPARKVWNHALIAYPALALLAGAACLPAAEWLDRHERAVRLLLLVLAGGAVACAPLIGRAVDGKPCTGSSEFAPELDRLAPGDEILVISSPTSWRTLASLSAERQVEPDPRRALPAAESATARVAIVQEDLAHGAPGWREIRRARGWVLLRKAE